MSEVKKSIHSARGSIRIHRAPKDGKDGKDFRYSDFTSTQLETLQNGVKTKIDTAAFRSDIGASIKADVKDSLKADSDFVAATKGEKGDMPYVVTTYALGGTFIRNGSGSVTLGARVTRGGDVVEDSTSQTQTFTYLWTKYDKNGAESNWVGTTSPTKTGNPITVTASEIDGKATFRCKVMKN